MKTKGLTGEIRIPISCSDDVVVARKEGRFMANDLGFSTGESTLVAAAISELARNIVTYASFGEIELSSNGADELCIVARDQGPGIAEIEIAMRSGFSTSGGLGLGLPGVKRIADRFDVQSDSNGTTVTLVKKSNNSARKD